MPDSSTILLVDDEDAVQKLLAYPLERDGFRVIQARDGEEALERFEREHVDLVVLDLMLPKLDGLEVCKRLRAGEHGADHHAHGPRRRARQGARPRARRGRLHHEAVLDPRVPQPRARAPSPRRAPRRPRRRQEEIEAKAFGSTSRAATVDRARRARAADLRRVRAPAHARLAPGPRLYPRAAAAGALGRLRVPRAADDRRPRPASAREARARPARAGVHPHRARRRLPLPRADEPLLRSVGARLASPCSSSSPARSGSSTWSVVPSLAVAPGGHARRPAAAAAQHLVPEASRRAAPAAGLRRHRSRTTSDARVVVYDDAVPGGSSAARRSPTRAEASPRPESTNDPIAMRALRSGRVEPGFVKQDEVHYAEAGIPYDGGDTSLLLRDSLEDQLGQRSPRAAPRALRGRRRAPDRAAARLRRRPGSSPAGSGGSSARRPDRGRPVRRAGRTTAAATSSATSPPLSTACAPARAARRRAP